jgi:hypothetical protein
MSPFRGSQTPRNWGAKRSAPSEMIGTDEYQLANNGQHSELTEDHK